MTTHVVIRLTTNAYTDTPPVVRAHGPCTVEEAYALLKVAETLLRDLKYEVQSTVPWRVTARRMPRTAITHSVWVLALGGMDDDVCAGIT